MQLIKAINAALAFSLEIAMYISYGRWGYSLSKNTFIKWLFAFIVPGIIVAIWALFAAPTAGFRLHQPLLFIAELGLMVIAAFLLFILHYAHLAYVLASLAVISQLLALILHQ